MTIKNFHERNIWLGSDAERIASAPLDGAVWITDDTHKVYCMISAAWVLVSGGGGGGGHVIADEGVARPAEPTLNFTGAGVTATDNPITTSTDVTIPGFTLPDHDHSGAGDGGQLDWDDIWSDAVHDHSSAGEGGSFDAANLESGASGDGDVLTSDGIGGAAWEAPAAGGDVFGPAGATDDDIVTFDTATGKLIQDSGVKLSGLIANPGSPEQGDILYWNGANWVRLAHGASTEYLKSGGHGANPGWYAPTIIIGVDEVLAPMNLIGWYC